MLLFQKFLQTIRIPNNTQLFSEEQIQEIQNYIHHNLKETLRIPELAKKAGTNQQYFKVQFKNTFGESVHEFIKNKRLNTALKLIRETQQSIGWIAIQVGYSSISSFSQAFKNKFGKSPQAYKVSKN